MAVQMKRFTNMQLAIKRELTRPLLQAGGKSVGSLASRELQFHFKIEQK